MDILGSARRFGDLVPALFSELALLWRQEAQLAGAELSENLRAIALGVGLLAGAAFLLIPISLLLLFAAVAALEAFGFAAYWAALIVAGGILLISLGLLVIGLYQLKAKSLLPRKAISQIRRDSSIFKRVVKAQ